MKFALIVMSITFFSLSTVVAQRVVKVTHAPKYPTKWKMFQDTVANIDTYYLSQDTIVFEMSTVSLSRLFVNSRDLKKPNFSDLIQSQIGGRFFITQNVIKASGEPNAEPAGTVRVSELHMRHNTSDGALIISKMQAGFLAMVNNKFKSVEINEFTGSLHVDANYYNSRKYESSLAVSQSVLKSVSIQDLVNYPRDSMLSIFFGHSRIGNFTAREMLNKKVNIYFSTDTLSGSFSASSYYKKGQRISINFYNSYVNCEFSGIDPGTHLQFNNCIFGPEAKFESMFTASIDFSNCTFTSPVPLSKSWEMSDKLILSVTQTDLKNLNFSYSNGFKLHLIPDKNNNKDHSDWIYTSLLDKFRSEGKQESYKLIDIEYKQYRYHQTVLGRIWDWIVKFWWYYGYEPFRVVWITLLWILLLSIVNLVYWDKVIRYYPVVGEFSSVRSGIRLTWRSFKARDFFHSFIFTCLIFFSLRIDFEKLSFSSNRWVAWFFIQYCSGLFCLYFILKYLLSS